MERKHSIPSKSKEKIEKLRHDFICDKRLIEFFLRIYQVYIIVHTCRNIAWLKVVN